MSRSRPGIDDTVAAPTRSGGGRFANETEAREHELERGTIVGRYMVLGKLGAGGMGVVYTAYDPELDRRVALKLLVPRVDGGLGSAGRARLLREAQALAKLSHPNVVAVHDVGMHGEGVWVAMELVVGDTLGVWAQARARRWPEILRVLTEAARGVAAAHRAGLIHRDLKPDNVMIDSDGRVRVMDFGLAHGRLVLTEAIDLATTAGSDSKARPELAALALRLTQVGAIQGTPAYMAPEQWLGQDAQVAADQFGWSVMAWELLFGERPFAGDTLMALAASVLAGQRKAPVKGRSVPGWLRRVIERGLAVDPQRRWPTMEALLAALERGTARAQVWVAGTAIAGIATLAAGATYNFASREAPAVTTCRNAPATPEDVWNAVAKQRVKNSVLATGAPYAEDVWRRVDVRLDDYAKQWATEHAAACEANVAGAQSNHILDLRNMCLAQRQEQVSQLIDILAHADSVVVQNAVQAASVLPSISFCGDIEQILTTVPPPADADTAKHVDEVRDRLARVAALEATGLYGPGVKLAAEVSAEAAALAYAPLTAEAALLEGSVLMAVGKFEQADVALSQAIALAIPQDLHAIAAQAAAKRIFVVGHGLGRHAEALVIEPFAGALVERVRDNGKLEALLANNLGAVYEVKGDHEEARTQYERSLAVLQRSQILDDPIGIVINHNLGGMYFEANQLPQARFHYGQARELSQKLLGERHPIGAHALAGLGDVDMREGQPEEAMRGYEAALAMMETAHGLDHVYLVHPLTGMGRVHEVAGHSDKARYYYTRSVDIVEKLGLLDHRMVAEAKEGLARLAEAAGEGGPNRLSP